MEEILARYLEDVQRRKAQRQHQQHKEDRMRYWTFPPRADSAPENNQTETSTTTTTTTTQQQTHLTPPIVHITPPPSPSASSTSSRLGITYVDSSTQTTSDVWTQTLSQQQKQQQQQQQHQSSSSSSSTSTSTTATPTVTVTVIEDGQRSPRSPVVKSSVVGNLIRESGKHRRSTSDGTVQTDHSSMLTTSNPPTTTSISIIPITPSPTRHISSSQLRVEQQQEAHSIHGRSRSDSSPRRMKHSSFSSTYPRSPLLSVTPLKSSPRLPRVANSSPTNNPTTNAAQILQTTPSQQLLSQSPQLWNGAAAVQLSLDEIEEELTKLSIRARDIGRELANSSRGVVGTTANTTITTTTTATTTGIRKRTNSGNGNLSPFIMSSSPNSSPSTNYRPAGRLSAYAPSPTRMMFGNADFGDFDTNNININDNVVEDLHFYHQKPTTKPTRQQKQKQKQTPPYHHQNQSQQRQIDDDNEESEEEVENEENEVYRTRAMRYTSSSTDESEGNSLTSPDQDKYVQITGSHSAFRRGKH